ncbi:MAG: PH domain-containing protein [Canibacter sp.]
MSSEDGLPDLQGPEQIVARVRQHGRALVAPIIVLFILAGAAGFFVGYFDALWQNLLAALGAALVLIFGVLVPIISWLTHRVTITTNRVIQRWGVLTRHRAEVPFTRIRTVRSHRTLGQRMFGCGDIELDIAEGEPMVLSSVPSISSVAEVLQQLVERSYRAQSRAQGFFTQSY